MMQGGFGLRVSGLGFRIEGLGFRIEGFGFGVLGFGFWVSGYLQYWRSFFPMSFVIPEDVLPAIALSSVSAEEPEP